MDIKKIDSFDIDGITKIAEFCGHDDFVDYNYPEDLNAMRVVEEKLNPEQHRLYVQRLCDNYGATGAIFASARRRYNNFLEVIDINKKYFEEKSVYEKDSGDKIQY